MGEGRGRAKIMKPPISVDEELYPVRHALGGLSGADAQDSPQLLADGETAVAVPELFRNARARH